MTNARIERLTREALGRRRGETPQPYKPEDPTLRAAGMVMLAIAVIVIAAWPRDEAGGAPHAAHASAHLVPISASSGQNSVALPGRSEERALPVQHRRPE